MNWLGGLALIWHR